MHSHQIHEKGSATLANCGMKIKTHSIQYGYHQGKNAGKHSGKRKSSFTAVEIANESSNNGDMHVCSSLYTGFFFHTIYTNHDFFFLNSSQDLPNSLATQHHTLSFISP